MVFLKFLCCVSGVGLFDNGTSIANNTALFWHGQRIKVYCYSNYTYDYGVIVVPNGRQYSRIYSYYSGPFTIMQQTPSGISLYTHTNRAPTIGIYTCKMSQHQQAWDMSFGIYDTPISEYYYLHLCALNVALLV